MGQNAVFPGTEAIHGVAVDIQPLYLSFLNHRQVGALVQTLPLVGPLFNTGPIGCRHKAALHLETAVVSIHPTEGHTAGTLLLILQLRVVGGGGVAFVLHALFHTWLEDNTPFEVRIAGLNIVGVEVTLLGGTVGKTHGQRLGQVGTPLCHQHGVGKREVLLVVQLHVGAL